MAIFSNPHLLNSARWKNMRVGLLGGSFNPPHEGHMHISLAALKGLELDCIWWLVTPQNPIKKVQAPPQNSRAALCRELVGDHPKILVSNIETEMKTNITYYTIKKLRESFPQTQFAWISGMDNALGLHKWNHWKDLLGQICMVHLTRNPARSLVRNCPYRMYSKQNHQFIDRGGKFPLDSGTTYWMMQKKMVNISSTEIRNNQVKTAA